MKVSPDSFLSPAELYGKLLSRQMCSSGAALASVWAQDASGVFLYAAAGENCDEIHAERYQPCLALAQQAIDTGAVTERRIDKCVMLAIPIFDKEKAYACSLLWSKTADGFEKEQRELAIVSAEAFPVNMERSRFLQPALRLEEGYLTLNGITKCYGEGDGTVHALRGINISIQRGELLVILGMSGSGKSTLLNIIGGLTHPTAGVVRTAESDLSGASSAALTAYRRDKLGFIFQFYNLISDLTAAENVAIAARLSKNAMPVEKALKFVGLKEKKDKYPAQLSGGEQQRVSIARAIVKQPDILLCDEPTGALDADTGKQVLRIITDLVGQQGSTAVIVTHCEAIAAMADRVIRLRNGRIVEEYVNLKKLPPEEIEW